MSNNVILKSLTFHNFRNLKNTQVVDIPDAPLLVAAAPNATGKTNFLEAITVLLRGKSFRASNEECVAWGEDVFLVSGVVAGRQGESKISVQYHTPSRKLRIEQDSHAISPVVFYSNYPFVLFLPEDTFLFHRGPAMRRNFLNNSLSPSVQYLSALVQYQKALKQRNSALKRAASSQDIRGWTDVLIEHADVVWTHRESLVAYTQAQLPGFVKELLGDIGDIQIRFTKGVPDESTLREALEGAWEQEQRYGYTLYGPHRDDVEVFINNKPIKSVLSRGQIRSIVIAMKVVSYRFMGQVFDVTPLLLFDEVLSELDVSRQKTLFSLLPTTQTIITCTDMPSEVRKRSDVYMLDLNSLTQPPIEVVTPKETEEIEVVGEELEEHAVA